jgi:hypothetical protein
MRRVMLLFVAVLGMLLTACAPAAAPAAPVQPTAAEVQPTTAPSAAAPTATESAASTTTEPAAPVATPDIEKVLNPQPDDHKRGPDGAPVTIIEWGDFQ